jgi:hypothetical protein
MKDCIELRSVIDQLREELYALTETVGGEDLRFAVENVEVELHVGVTKEGKAGAKAKFWVLEVGAEGKYGTVQTQTIKLKLKPRLKGAKEGEDIMLIGRND